MTQTFHIQQLCCEGCTHTQEKPCNRYVECLTEGPLCHTHADCSLRRHHFFEKFLREDVDHPVIYVGAGTCGLGAGAGKVIKALTEYIASKKLPIELIKVGCIGFCVAEPLVDFQIPGKPRLSFRNQTPESAIQALEAILDGKISDSSQILAQFDSKTLQPWPNVTLLSEHPFFKNQVRWVLENCGMINPQSIEEYIARGGYRALAKAVGTLTPQEVCNQIEISGLRGRGGGGFPTGKKWKIALDTHAEQKYFICNADEGDPGAFMDRAVIEGDPHRVLEGLAIGAYAIGASVAYVYIRAEYPQAIAHLKEAITDATHWGFLGNNILDSGFNLKIIIKEGAGAFVCGEETALIHSIEGKRGMPRPRPPYPAIQGLFGKPTVINNVETLANLPPILRNGPEWFNAVGTPSSKGTKVFALSGKVKNTGLIEVKMGTKIRDIIFDIGGGVPGNHTFKAVQMGGPSGGCIPTEHLDIQIDYESLKTVGAMMGSGGMVVMDDATCMVDIAKFFMDFIQRESCGKCISCREGTKRLLEIFTLITTHQKHEKGNDALNRMQAVMYLEHLAEVIQETSLCGLGMSAPNPILSTLRYFRHEYEAHVFERRCPAKACKALLNYSINEEKCIGCTLCAKKCPANAIKGTLKAPHYIVKELCINCGSCVDACKKSAINVE